MAIPKFAARPDLKSPDAEQRTSGLLLEVEPQHAYTLIEGNAVLEAFTPSRDGPKFSGLGWIILGAIGGPLLVRMLERRGR